MGTVRFRAWLGDRVFLLRSDGAGSFRPVFIAALSALLTGCVHSIESGPPLRSPGEVADRTAAAGNRSVAATLTFDWRYADRRGDVGGEGIGRYNPPDSLRVDLFTSGDVAMAIAVAGDELRSLGEIEDVEIPGLEFVYAMAGLFRPGSGSPEGYLVGRDSVLVYGASSDRRTYYYIRDGRLRRVEDRLHGSTVQRVNIDWEIGGTWPVQAEYRNLVEHSRVRWKVTDVRHEQESHPGYVYELPPIP